MAENPETSPEPPRNRPGTHSRPTRRRALGPRVFPEDVKHRVGSSVDVMTSGVFGGTSLRRPAASDREIPMFALYVFASVVGVSLLALGMLGGEGGPDEFELDFDGDFDAGEADSSWKKAFSLRSAAYFMAGFGATGVLLTFFETTPGVTLAIAVAMGGFSAVLVAALFGWLRRSEGGFSTTADSYIGAVGEVRLPIRDRTPGSVAIEHEGRVLVMRALAMGTPESDPSTWSRVLVVDVEESQGLLLVQPVGEFLADESDSGRPDGGPPSP